MTGVQTCALPICLKNVELVGVSDVNVELGLDTASKYRVRFFEDYHTLIEHVDAVCVAVPTRLHHTVGMICLRAGIHVLIEKVNTSNIEPLHAELEIGRAHV